jgi:hypothetical protein
MSKRLDRTIAKAEALLERLERRESAALRVVEQLKLRETMTLRVLRRHESLVAELHNAVIAVRELAGGQNSREQIRTALNVLSDELRRRDGSEVYNRKHAILAPVVRRLEHIDKPVDEIVKHVRAVYDEIKVAESPLEAIELGLRAKKRGKKKGGKTR